MDDEDDDDDFDVQLDEQAHRGRPTQQAQRQVALSNAAMGATPGQAAAGIPVLGRLLYHFCVVIFCLLLVILSTNSIASCLFLLHANTKNQTTACTFPLPKKAHSCCTQCTQHVIPHLSFAINTLLLDSIQSPPPAQGLATAASMGGPPIAAPALPGPPRAAPPAAIPGSAGYGMAARPPPGVTWARPKYVNVHTGALLLGDDLTASVCVQCLQSVCIHTEVKESVHYYSLLLS